MLDSSRLRYAPLLVFQIILVVLYMVFTTYGGIEDAKLLGYEDTHVMIFIGFAYLMTFLKKYCYSALGYNWFLAALVIQWSLLCQAFFHMKDGKILITKKHMLEADIMSATVLITFGCLLGLASGTQLLFIAIVEAAIGSVNLKYLNEEVFQIADIGGSIGIHTYGAYFGLGVSAAFRMMKRSKDEQPSPTAVALDGPSYTSDVTAMIGSIFLWIYWPSFNAALTTTTESYQRALINTYLSLASCTVTTFVLSAAVCHKPGKLDMVHIQNSTLAGGVAVGAVANMFIGPGVAMAIGMGAAFISVLGYRYLSPLLENLGIQDTCGVNNLHGMPGIYSGLLSVLFAALATTDTYGTELAAVFPAVAGEEASPGPGDSQPTSTGMHEPRAIEKQALYQLIALGTTMGVAIVSGLICGFVAKMEIFTPLKKPERYDDEVNWELP